MEKSYKMRNALIFILLLAAMISCKQEQDVRGLQGPEEVQVRQPDTLQFTLEEQAKELQELGYQTFLYGEEGEKELMQQYYIVFLKSGKNRTQDSATAAQLQKQHLAHLNRMAADGYLSLAGPFGDDGDIRGIAVYNTPTIEMADSLARLDPMVQVGRLEVEIHPWWANKGGELK